MTRQIQLIKYQFIGSPFTKHTSREELRTWSCAGGAFIEGSWRSREPNPWGRYAEEQSKNASFELLSIGGGENGRTPQGREEASRKPRNEGLALQMDKLYQGTVLSPQIRPNALACSGLSKAMVCSSKWAALLLQEPGWDGSHMQVAHQVLLANHSTWLIKTDFQGHNIFARSDHPHRELLLQLCRQQWRRHSDLPLEVINLVKRLDHYSCVTIHYSWITVASPSLGHPSYLRGHFLQNLRLWSLSGLPLRWRGRSG